MSSARRRALEKQCRLWEKQPLSSFASTAFTVALSATLCVSLLTACDEDKSGRSADSSLGSLTVTGNLIRPRIDPRVVDQIKQEEQEAQRKAMAAAQAQQAQANQQQQVAFANSDPSQRDLPPVDTSPISGIANMLGLGNKGQPQASPNGMQPPQMPATIPSPPPMASYGGYPTAPAAGLIPPPPVVSTTATVYAPPPDAYGAYGGYPPSQYPGSYPPQYQPPPLAQSQPSHPAGSMFSSGGSGGSSSSDDSEAKKKQNVVLITPTGMESRSPYKQRDDLKMLVKGAFATNKELRDAKVQQAISKVDVGLPSEYTRGNINLSQRQIDNLFKTPQVDKKAAPTVKKIEADVAQAYFRYLYAFNKYSLAQQQVAARKQEVDIADSASEKQRAAADLASAQSDADSSKDDLHASQIELASIAGAQSARSVIAKVSGVAPSLDSIGSSDGGSDTNQGSGKKDESFMNALNPMNVFNVFGHKGKDGGDKAPAKTAAAASSDAQPASDKKKSKKQRSTQIATTEPVKESAPDPAPVERSSPSPSIPASAGPLTFELKNVQTTPRKSILKVAIRNNGGDSVNIDSEAISVAEGDHKIADASVRAEFDTALVQPNQEVTGTITIFGRPWNDKLTVSLMENGKPIPLHR